MKMANLNAIMGEVSGLPISAPLSTRLSTIVVRRIGNGRRSGWSRVRMHAVPPDVQYHMQQQLMPNQQSEIASTGNSIAYETIALRAPITKERTVSVKDVAIDNPQLPRALAAVDAEHPEGTVGRDPKGYTVLQQHVAFFDRNQDGVIYPPETYQGFRALGYTRAISLLASAVINGAFSYPTYDVSLADGGDGGWIPDLRFPIYIETIHRTKHGSDTDVYDTEGRFVPYKFEEMFNKYALTEPGKMTYDEIIRMTESNRNVNDLFGWNTAKLEWGFTYWLVKDEQGFATKDAIRGVYDGSFFEYMEGKLKAGDTSNIKEVELEKTDPGNLN